MANRNIISIPVTIPVSASPQSLTFTKDSDKDCELLTGLVIPLPDLDSHADWPWSDITMAVMVNSRTVLDFAPVHLFRDNGSRSAPFVPINVRGQGDKIEVLIYAPVVTAEIKFTVVFKQD